jgi:hypothetical protein
MRRLRHFWTAPPVAALLALAACTGAPAGGSTDTPAGALNAAIAAAESNGLDAMVDFACEARKGDIAEAFGGGGGMEGLAALGIDPNELFDAMKVDFQDVTTTETSSTDTEATVHIKGKMLITLEEAKMREILKKVLEAQGQPTNDQVLDGAMQMLGGQLSQTQDLDEDVQIVKDNGKWLVCS